MGTAVWHMSLKLEKTTTIVETNMALVTTKISSIEKDIASLEEQIRESRTGRVELWKEVNVLRERAAMIEVAQKKEC
jgi:cell division protein FtsL